MVALLSVLEVAVRSCVDLEQSNPGWSEWKEGEEV